MDVRASRTISTDQVEQLEQMVFAGGAPNPDQLDLLFLVDTYLLRSHPRWAELLARAAQEASPNRRTNGAAPKSSSEGA